MLIEGTVLILGFGHGGLTLRDRHRSTALRIGHQQGPCLPDAIAPCRYVGALQPTIRLVGRILCLLCQLALAAHRLLAVLIGVVEVGDIDTQAQQTTDEGRQAAFQPAFHLLLAYRIHQIGYCHQQHNRQEVIGHLQVIREDLQGREDTRYGNTSHILTSVAKHHTGYCGRNEAQSEQFPDVAGGYNDKVIAGEGPQYRSEGSHPLTEIKGAQQYIKAQKHHEHIASHRG